MEQWFYSASPAERQRRREEVRARFRAADRDGDGQLDRTEWRAVLTRSGVPATESVAIVPGLNPHQYIELSAGRRWTSSSPPWTATTTVGSRSRSSWGRRRLWRNSSNLWIRTEMDLSPKR